MNDYPHNLSIQIGSPSQNYQIVEFKGDMDKSGLYEINEKIKTLIEKFPLQYLVFDFSNLNFINSESIGFLMSIHSHLAKIGKTFILIGAKPNIKDIFNVIGLFNVISYYDSLAFFLEKTGT